ncbi:MAG: penicillin-binding transpeptidase domain-containing protein, partial [Actinomycetes bacterium]
MIVIFIVAAMCVGRLVQYQVFEAPTINALSFDKRSVHHTIRAIRGDIIDANGVVLATTVIRYDVNAAPDIVTPVTRIVDGQTITRTPADIAAELSPILKMKPSEILTKITGTTKYSNIKKKVSATDWRRIEKLDIPWIFSDKVQVRVYPNGAIAGNLIGFLGNDGTPLAGLERTMNECLAGVDGEETYESGGDGIKIPSSTVTTRKARNGSTVVLTIHNDLQYAAQQIMTNYVKDERADWGSAVVVEAKTGKILTAAEYPSVDPNVFFQSKAADRGSRIFQATFEPGSTMKTVAAATAIDVGEATPATQVRAPQTLFLPWGDTISDSHQHPTQKLTLTGVLRESSNTGIVEIVKGVSSKTRYDYLKKFGVGSP